MSGYVSQITIKAIDLVTPVTKQITKSINTMRVANISLRGSINDAGVAARDFGLRMRNLALVVSAVGTGIFLAAQRQGHAAEEMLNLSERTGVATDALQKLGYVASLSNVQVGDMANAFKFLNKSIADASTDAGSEAAQAFASMGVSLKDANGQLKNTNQLFLDVSDVFKKSADGPAKVRTAMTLLGRAGTELIPVLNQGSAAIKAQGDEFARLGNVLSGDELKAADEFGDNIQRLGVSVKGLVSIFIQQLIPVLNPIIVQFREFVASNKDLIKTRASEFVSGLRDAFFGLWNAFLIVKAIFVPLIDGFGGIIGVIKILAGLYLLSLAMSFLRIVGTLGQLIIGIFTFGRVLMSLPILSIVGWLGLLLAAGIAIYAFWPEISKAVSDAWDWVMQSTDGFGKWFDQFVQWFASLFPDVIEKSILDFYTSVKEVFASLMTWLVDNFWTPMFEYFNKFSEWLSKIKGAFSGAFSGAASLGAPTPPTGLGNVDAPIPQGALASSLAGGNQNINMYMKIDSEGRVKDVQATGDQNLTLKTDTGRLY